MVANVKGLSYEPEPPVDHDAMSDWISQYGRECDYLPAVYPRPSQLYAVVDVPQSLALTQLSGSGLINISKLS